MAAQLFDAPEGFYQVSGTVMTRVGYRLAGRVPRGMQDFPLLTNPSLVGAVLKIWLARECAVDGFK